MLRVRVVRSDGLDGHAGSLKICPFTWDSTRETMLTMIR